MNLSFRLWFENLAEWEEEIFDWAMAQGLDLTVSIQDIPAELVEPYEINQDERKIRRLQKAYSRGRNIPYIWITDSYRLLDGHHRWLARGAIGQIRAYVVNSDTHLKLRTQFDMANVDVIEFLAKLNNIAYKN
jgi:hypothetical protein